MTNVLNDAQAEYWFPRESFWRQRFAEANNFAETLRLARELCYLSFQAGAAWNFHETSKLSPHIAKFLEMCVLLGPNPYEDENPSPYYPSPSPGEPIADNGPI